MPIPSTINRFQELESAFGRFPDVPREIVLKPDLLRLGHWFTDAALEKARGSLTKTYRLFSYDLVSMDKLNRNEHRTVPEWFMIRDGIYDLRPVLVQTTLDPSSPYVIDVVDDMPTLTSEGQPICPVFFPPAMDFDVKTFDDGSEYRDYVAYGYFVTVFRYCQYWGPNEECRFCDINWNARQMKKSHDFTFDAPVKPLNRILEVARDVEAEMERRAGASVPIEFLITGGTILNQLQGKGEDDFYLEYASALKWDGKRRYINLQTNAKNREILKRYRAAGVDSHHANMEVWDRSLFEWINPGKARVVGYDNWVRWMADSVDVFGEGHVRPNFVCGIEMARPHGFQTVEEAVRSTCEGITFMMKRGIFPRFNIWRREPHTNLVSEQEQPPVPLELYIRVTQHFYETWKACGLPPSHRNMAHPQRRVMGRDHGTYDDILLLNEHPDYTQRVDRVLREGLSAARSCWS